MIFLDYSLEEKLVSFLLLFLVVELLFEFPKRSWSLSCYLGSYFCYSFVAEAVDLLSTHHE